MAEHAPPQLFLVDGYALIYRAFFALISRPLRTARGENTSAVWGVTNFLLRLREKYRPDYVVWINDAGDSFRTAEYPEYKSTREKLDEELQADFDRALERVRVLLTGFRIPLVEVAGYEADDVIGTLALRAAAQGLQAVIVSGDKDFYQLIRPGISLLNPGRGGPAGVDEVWVTEANANDRLGVPPSQVTDWLALVGDSSDNVPGVKGIGEKGAVQLLREFGDLETLLARAAEVKQKRSREALQQQADAARLSRRLVTIMTDVPVELDLGTITAHPPDQPALAKLFVELEFQSLLPRLGPSGATAPVPMTESSGGQDHGAAVVAESSNPAMAATASAVLGAPDYTTITVTDAAELPAIVVRLRTAPLVAFDCETSSLSPHDADLIGLSLAASPTEVWYFPFGHRQPSNDLFQATTDTTVRKVVRNLPPITSPACAPIKDLLQDASVPKAAHNAKYDVQVLRRAGVAVAGVVFDSMLASFVLDPSRRSHGIDSLSVEFFGRTMTQYTDLTGKGKNQLPFAEVSVARAAAYCGADSATVLALHQHFQPELERTALLPLFAEIEMPLIP
ncbi:MAG: 5'-3' exonuclease H3TH domain-containing protein, partial [Gemmatimonadales bacterium]